MLVRGAIGQSATQTGAYASIGGTTTIPIIGPSTSTTSLGFFAVGVTLAQESEEGAVPFPPPMTAPVASALVLRLLVAPALLLLQTMILWRCPCLIPPFRSGNRAWCGWNCRVPLCN